MPLTQGYGLGRSDVSGFGLGGAPRPSGIPGYGRNPALLRAASAGMSGLASRPVGIPGASGGLDRDLIMALLNARPGAFPRRRRAVPASIGGIQSFQTGGVVDEPTLAMLGEAGPEAVVPIPTTQAGRHALMRGGGLEAQASQMLGQATQAGLFNPLGSPRIRALLKRRAMRLAEARRQRAMRGAGLNRLDPYSARIAAVNADIGASGDVSQALNEAELQGLTSNQQFYRDLFSGRLSQASAERIAREQRKAAERQAQGQLLGTFGGAAIGLI